jgi:hypothetical protein
LDAYVLTVRNSRSTTGNVLPYLAFLYESAILVQARYNSQAALVRMCEEAEKSGFGAGKECEEEAISLNIN